MVYIFDTSSFRVLNHYFPQIFPTVWQNINLLVDNGLLISVREVRRELDAVENRHLFFDSVNNYNDIFLQPTV